jgi:Secretion system C-terminal sorting domain
MKTTISLLATWLCMAYSLLAQPVYDACATPPQPGEIWMEETTVCYDNGVSPGPSGSNVVWDFSNWNVQTSYSGIDTFYATSSLPQSSSFPTSNLATVRGDMRLFWDYSPSGISHCGSYFSYYNHYNIYSDLNKFMQCPQHFQDDFYETYDYVSSPSLFFHGGKTTTYDGYGKLILPGHTYQDVIRIHSLDTVFQSGGYELFNNYLWIETTNFRSVCSISTSTVFGGPGSYTYVNYYTHTYLGMLPTTNAQPLPQVQIFPNPTSGQLRIEGEGFEKGLVTVTSLTGQVVKHLTIRSREVDLSELPSGMYLYSVQNVPGEVIKTGKLVKQ